MTVDYKSTIFLPNTDFPMKAGLPVRGGGRRGDMHLQVQVDVPKTLSGQQRDALNAFAAATAQMPQAHEDSLVARLRRVFDR